jgi:hypothetical protein
MARATTNAGILGEWQRLGVAFDANAADLADLAPSRERLGALLERVIEVSQEQAAHTAAKQLATQELRDILAEGQRLATGLRKLIKNHYGISSEKLAEFAIQPFRSRKRKVQPVEIPEEPEAPSPE